MFHHENTTSNLIMHSFPCVFLLQFFGQANFQKGEIGFPVSRNLYDDRHVSLVTTLKSHSNLSLIYTFKFWTDPSKSEIVEMKHLGKKGL